jgi:aspartyl-tRNA(Asn)/glutamyl-tRNA(Gln) amidotransferase subunit B
MFDTLKGTADTVIELSNICFMGSTVVSGSAVCIVVETGKKTYLGNIASKLNVPKETTNFEIGIKKITGLLIKYMAVIVCAVFLINGLVKKDWIQALMFSISVAVGITPGMLSMIVNVNLSKGAKFLSKKKTLVKNMNSMKALQKALEYEEKRQKEILESGGKVLQETRRWDEEKGITVSMRSKELAHDYRYFPEPDLALVLIDRKWVSDIETSIPELADKKRLRFLKQYSLPEYDAMVLTSSKALSEFFEKCVGEYRNPKTVSNWMMGELLRLINEKGLGIEEIKFPPSYLAALLKLVENSTISGTAAKTVFEAMFDSGREPSTLIKELGLEQIEDEDAILEIVRKVLKESTEAIADYRAGKDRALGFLVGQTMKASKGKGNPKVISRLIKSELDRT